MIKTITHEVRHAPFIPILYMCVYLFQWDLHSKAFGVEERVPIGICTKSMKIPIYILYTEEGLNQDIIQNSSALIVPNSKYTEISTLEFHTTTTFWGHAQVSTQAKHFGITRVGMKPFQESTVINVWWIKLFITVFISCIKEWYTCILIHFWQ